MPSTRRERLLFGIDPETSSGLEIGALCWPVISDGNANIRYADRLSTAELQQRYAEDPLVTAANIVHVDYVCKGISLSQAVGKENCFDYVIASHVIEHVPDVIGWLRDIHSLLKPGGKLCLAIPDQRFTFDCNRAPTGAAVLIEDYLLERQSPSPRAVFDHMAHHADLSRNPPSPSYSIQEALGLARDARENYHDVHCLVATPASFVGLLAPLFELALVEYRVASLVDTAPGENEFFIQLEKIDVTLPDNRTRQLESLERMRHRLNSAASRVLNIDASATI